MHIFICIEKHCTWSGLCIASEKLNSIRVFYREYFAQNMLKGYGRQLGLRAKDKDLKHIFIKF